MKSHINPMPHMGLIHIDVSSILIHKRVPINAKPGGTGVTYGNWQSTNKGYGKPMYKGNS